MKKRIFAMLMAAAMMLSMAACGNGAEEKKTENSAGTEAQAADGESTLACTEIGLVAVKRAIVKTL